MLAVLAMLVLLRSAIAIGPPQRMLPSQRTLAHAENATLIRATVKTLFAKVRPISLTTNKIFIKYSFTLL